MTTPDHTSDEQAPAEPAPIDDDALEFVSGGLKNIPSTGGGFTVNSTITYPTY